MSAWINKCHFGDCLQVLQRMPDGIAQTCVTSPPYFGLRDYGRPEQIGLEATPEEFITKLVGVFREVRRVLRDDGTLWVNIGDSYGRTGGSDRGASRSATVGNTLRSLEAIPDRRQKTPQGIKEKDLIGIPWMLAFALRADGWYLRQDIIWAKPNPMPESVTDRCTKSHEYIFLLSKSPGYYCDMAAIKVPGKNPADDIRRMNQQRAENKSMPDEKVNGLRPRKAGPNAMRGQGQNRAAGGGQANRAGRDMSEIGTEGTANKPSVWTVATKPYKGAHFATFPTELIQPCILAGAPAGGVVLDPFFGSGTTGQVSQSLSRAFIGIELNTDYKALQDERLCQPSLDLEAA